MKEIKTNKIPYSILELATVGAGFTPKEVFDNSLELAQKAEEFGYNRFWLAEHHNMLSIASSATSVLMGHIAGGTKKIRVGSGGIMLPNHSSLLIAEQFGTLASLYPGRIDLGLGSAPGTDQVTANAIRPDRMEAVYRFPEEMHNIQKYFSKDNKDAKVRAPIAEGVDVPIYILGSSTDSAYLAAKEGLPYVFASHFAPTHLLEALNIYYNNFQPSKYLQDPYSVAAINVVAAETDEEADTISTSMLRLMLGVMTGKIDYMQPAIKMTPELKQVSVDPAFQRMLKYAFVGSKATVKEKTEAFIKQTGVNEVIAVSHIYDQKDRINSFRLFSEVMNEM
ncbi:LLM class flavin-dependent oxidoreductase [Zobellia laminariae]|uniref:LLM class flavin-dependent oxidoreductase n=1 Tax=Zobellia laminariae TaxID=248906 RepID=UPI0026F41030|nr:LLM class flavin-dependent oxidoreductase [Zobellia laminariae]WKX77900.1 LLM class flavin-dependent oxidoreductase [Zobellia laminariae]